MLRIIRDLIEFKQKVEKQILQAFKFLSNVMKKKAIVFMLSDFMTEGYENTQNCR